MRKLSEVEVDVPIQGDLPKVRRQVERICEALGVEYGNLVELRIEPGLANVIQFLRDADGKICADSAGRPATRMDAIPVDTYTFIGDERDF